MIDFLLGVLIVAGIGTACTVALAVWLLAWGSRRQRLADAWDDGYITAKIDVDNQRHSAGVGYSYLHEPSRNPFLRDHEQLHRAG